MSGTWPQSILILLAALTFVTQPAFADATDLARQADKVVRNAERKMHSGKNQEADALLQQAATLLEQARVEDPGDKMLLRVDKKYGQVRKNVDRKLSQKALAQPSTTPAATGAKVSGSGKLPGGVSKRLKDISRHLDQAERYVNRDARKANYKLEQAQGLFDEIDSKYGGQFDKTHPEYVAVSGRYQQLAGQTADQGAAEEKAKTDAEMAAATKERQSAEWVPKFQAYLSYPGQEGHNPDMLVFVPGTSEPEKFADAQQRYEAFKGFYAEYQATEFPHGKTWKLESLGDNEAPTRLKEYEEGMASRVGSVAAAAENQIDQAMAQLEKDNGWRSDESLKPNLLDHKWMSSITESTQKVVTALGADDPTAQQVQAKYEALVAKDTENRQIRKERTFMTPDRYPGSDIEDLRAKATSLVKNDNAEGGEPLRTTVISENWREETVWEWTDTSKSAKRWRTTRHLTAQVAARTADGVRLITVALAKDKQSDGSWGPLYGNLHQYSDPMLEANVFKDGP